MQKNKKIKVTSSSLHDIRPSIASVTISEAPAMGTCSGGTTSPSTTASRCRKRRFSTSPAAASDGFLLLRRPQAGAAPAPKPVPQVRRGDQLSRPTPLSLADIRPSIASATISEAPTMGNMLRKYDLSVNHCKQVPQAMIFYRSGGRK
ncbi:collagen alpha-2(IV) chain [Striga asiatica]|uniref:Collagen alpha-2(IV) chain n=1 Tax=Striga asiatica TaxID=4170 RepID=A0A5A7P0U3_STRAF|nr:collagen alpha-2(IV) chain [Striga asiatica]